MMKVNLDATTTLTLSLPEIMDFREFSGLVDSLKQIVKTHEEPIEKQVRKGQSHTGRKMSERWTLEKAKTFFSEKSACRNADDKAALAKRYGLAEIDKVGYYLKRKFKELR